jgi:transposase
MGRPLKIPESEHLDIIELYADGQGETSSEIARLYGVSVSTISSLLNRYGVVVLQRNGNLYRTGSVNLTDDQKLEVALAYQAKMSTPDITRVTGFTGAQIRRALIDVDVARLAQGNVRKAINDGV